MQRIITFKKVKGILIEESQGSTFASFTLKLRLVLFRVSLLSNFKSDENIKFLRPKGCSYGG